MDRKLIKTVLQILFASFSVFAIVFSVCLYLATKSSDYIDKCPVIVKQTSDSYIIDFVKKNHISSSELVIKLCLKLLRYRDIHVFVGEYSLRNNISLMSALEILSSNQSIKRKICIPEGFSVAQALHRINKNEFLLGEIVEIPPEGSLMPATYVFKYPTTRQEIIERARQAMSEFVKKTWQSRPKNCELKSPEDLVKLASIVEKERTKNDAASIAGVYLNRLRKGMKLQSDPTTIYAITRGKKLGRPLKLSDLQLDSPYNTYKKFGLPDTPICNPGRDAILSVLYPQNHNYFFFAHDKDGNIYLSESFEEHKKNAKKVQKDRKNLIYKKEEF